MDTITSTRNAKIQWVRKLQAQSRARREAGLFIVEGVRLAEEALQAGWPAELVLYSNDLSPRGQELLPGFAAAGATLQPVAEHVLRSASDTQTPQGILALIAQRSLPIPPSLDLAFIPDAVRDPGNLGTMLRTAAAAGAGAVFLPPGVVDLFSPKVVRAAMGAHFRLPVHPLEWPQIGAQVESAGLQVYLAAAGTGTVYTAADFRRPLALVIGGEAAGAGPEAERLAGEHVHIPMPGGVESLNAAVAAAILLFEVVRQRSLA